MDTFPYETWEEATNAAVDAAAGYFTFGPGSNVGTVIVVALGFLLMIAVLVAFIRQEDRKLSAQAERLSSGGDG